MLSGIFSGKKVLVTGHTGFKGSWLSQWLLELGANVVGYSLPAPTEPSLFGQLGLGNRVESVLGDIRNREAVLNLVKQLKPDFVFHLAAQPLVRLSYAEPVETFEVNIMGSINVLDALKQQDSPCAVVMVTTDKCYENREWEYGYREDDKLGGHDPYSASKAATEIAIASYRQSFLSPAKILLGSAPPIAVVSARAGNVIGGGDWAVDRIVPDVIRALAAGKEIQVRNPQSTRPWQHVLEPLGGYLLAAQKAYEQLENRHTKLASFATSFNFGPQLTSNQNVRRLVEKILEFWPGTWKDCSTSDALHEAGRLNLSIDKAFSILGWSPVWDFNETVENTVQWYKNISRNSSSDALMLTQKQIQLYSGRASNRTQS